MGAEPEGGGVRCGCHGWGVEADIALVKCAWGGATCKDSSARPGCSKRLHLACMHDAVDARFCCAECQEAGEADAAAAAAEMDGRSPERTFRGYEPESL